MRPKKKREKTETNWGAGLKFNLKSGAREEGKKSTVLDQQATWNRRGIRECSIARQQTAQDFERAIKVVFGKKKKTKG